jgi:hypothetical protein
VNNVSGSALCAIISVRGVKFVETISRMTGLYVAAGEASIGVR